MSVRLLQQNYERLKGSDGKLRNFDLYECSFCLKPFSVRRGQVQNLRSCGCAKGKAISESLKARHRANFEPGQSNCTRVYHNYRHNAKRAGRLWEITKEEFINLSQQSCHYCGEVQSNRMETRDSIGPYLYNGIDRVDNDKGYIQGNVVPCCKTCNKAKSDLGAQQFLDWTRKVVEWQSMQQTKNES